MADEYDPAEIQAIDGVTCIRRRPSLFIGDLDDPAAITTMLTEAACLAFDNITSGCASGVQITLRADGSAAIRNDGPGVEVGQEKFKSDAEYRGANKTSSANISDK